MEANIAYYCLHKLHKWPHEFLELPRREQIFVITAVRMKVEKDQKEAKRMKAKGRRR